MLLWVNNSRRKEASSRGSKASCGSWLLVRRSRASLIDMITYLPGFQHPLEIPPYPLYTLDCSFTPLSPHTMDFLHFNSLLMSFSVRCPSLIFICWNPIPFSKAHLEVTFSHEAFLRFLFLPEVNVSSMFPQHFVYFSEHLSNLYVIALHATALFPFRVIQVSSHAYSLHIPT